MNRQQSTLWLAAVLPVTVVLLVIVAFLFATTPGRRAAEALGLRATSTPTATPTPTITPTPTTIPCSDAILAYSDDLSPILDKWDDAIKVAYSTSRSSLSPVIQDMQDIKREAEAVEPPACGGTARLLLLKSMEAYINGFIAFMGNESDSVVSDYFSEALTAIDDFYVEIATRLKSSS